MQELLALIRRAESDGAVRSQGAASAYDVVFGGIRIADRPPRPLRTMTVGEVLAWQDSIDARYQSEAAGAYQIMEDTLRDLVRRGVVSTEARFGEATQDACAIALMQPWLERYMRGDLAPEDFANRLAMIWAGLPVVYPMTRSDGVTREPGQSYYGGIGANTDTAHVDDVEFLETVKALRAPRVAPVRTDPPRPRPEILTPSRVAQIAAGGGGVTILGTAAHEIAGMAGLGIFLAVATVAVAAFLIIRRIRR